jgi:hypothetical protein
VGSADVWILALFFYMIWMVISHVKQLWLLEFLCLLFLENILFAVICVHLDFILVLSDCWSVECDTILASISLKRHLRVIISILRRGQLLSVRCMRVFIPFFWRHQLLVPYQRSNSIILLICLIGLHGHLILKHCRLVYFSLSLLIARITWE